MNYEGGARIGGIRISNLRYADDILLVAETKEDLQLIMDFVQEASTAMGLTVNEAKTATMSLNTECKAEVSLYQQRVPSCDRFKYLGVIFNTYSNGSEDFDSGMDLGYAKAAQLQPILTRKVRVLQSMVFAVLTNGREAKEERATLRLFETKCYRRALNLPYGERITNARLFKLANCEPSLEGQYMGRKLAYFGHIVRHNSLERDIMLGICPVNDAKAGKDDSGTTMS